MPPAHLLLAIFAISALAQTVDPKVGHIHTDAAFRVTRFADKQYVDAPIALSMDASGALFVAEARRFRRGAEDTRSRGFWMMDELAIQRLDDRMAQYDKWIAAGKFSPDYFTAVADRVVKIRDSDGDGTADSHSLFAEFSEPLDGIAASVLAYKDKVYFTCIPHLWLLADPDQDGIAESRVSLQKGFGLRSGVSGHDMHGLEFGPDGKLYWSIGDRGYNFVSKEGKHFKDAESGAVFRCDPDGSNIEIFCRGGRNPQDLAFDAYGNLFTVDNNQGGGDRSRVCYLVEGGDYGWNSGCTNLMTFRTPSGLADLAGPRIAPAYMAEGIWKQAFPEQPAHVIPAIDFIDGGSAGLTYIPGASLGNHFQEHFAFCALGRGIKTFAISADGAGFRMVDYHDFWRGGSPIDTEFGHDGELYVADYAGSGGNIYRLRHPQAVRRPSVIEAAKILRQPLAEFAEEQLFELLAQRDQRVRLQAQFELAARGAKDSLIKAATTPVPEVPEGEPEVDPEPLPDELGDTEADGHRERQTGAWDSLTMGSPASDDQASSATVTYVDHASLAKPHLQAGAEGMRLPRLTDGLAATNDDDVTRCVWLDGKPCRLIMDLGEAIEVAQVHTYSWHKGNRSPQTFSLYGSAEPQPNPLNPTDWIQLGAVDTAALGGGGKHGSVIGKGESMGRFRYLMWQASNHPGTFFTEFDVYTPEHAPPILNPTKTAATQLVHGPWTAFAMGPPSAADFANRNEVRVTYALGPDLAVPHKLAGAEDLLLPRLNDGDAAKNNDDVTRCSWLDGKPYAILMDLGSIQPIHQVHSYSWHWGNRSPQKFELLGSVDSEQWTTLAKVDSSQWGQGGKHGSVVRREGGALGNFRHLTWKVATPGAAGTFFTELDVYTSAENAPEVGAMPSLVREPDFAPEPFNGPLLRRLHGIWGLGQLGDAKPLIPLLSDPHFRVRAQSAKVLGDIGDVSAGPGLTSLLQDESARVQAFAATALGKIRYRPAIPALIDLIARNNNADPVLRHAAIFGLEGIGEVDIIDHSSGAVRLGLLVLLRRAGDARVARYLKDSDPRVVQEAIAAINDARIDAAEPALAAHLRNYLNPEAVRPSTLSFDRMINAAFRQGSAASLGTLLDIGAAEHLPERIRSAALFRLERWNNPYIVDPTLGQIREFPPDRFEGVSMIRAAVAAQLPGAKGQVLSALYHLADVYDVPLDPANLQRRVLSAGTELPRRLEALKSLRNNPTDSFTATLETLLGDEAVELRVEALRMLAAHAPDAAAAHIRRFIKIGLPRERQAAYSVTTDSDLLIQGLQDLLADSAHFDAALELLEACADRQEPEIQRLLSQVPANQATLAGGDSESGETIVREHGTAACIICHSINGKGGVVAPDLAKVGLRATDDYLLESLLQPSAHIVPGYGAMTVALKDGQTRTGSLLRQSNKELVLKAADGNKQAIQLANIASRSDAISTMPPMGDILSKSEIRDVIAYLRALNGTEIAYVRNAGAGGHTSGQLLARLDRDVLAYRPTTVVLMVGTNDRLNSRKLTSAADYRRNIEHLVERIEKAGADILLVTPPPCEAKALFTRHDPALFADQSPNARMAEVRDILLAHNLPTVDFHAHVLANSALLSTDGVHLTPDGYRDLATKIAGSLRHNRFDLRRVICFGDSLTAGPYPDELQRHLRAPLAVE